VPLLGLYEKSGRYSNEKEESLHADLEVVDLACNREFYLGIPRISIPRAKVIPD
jgi:hypothetical protein